MKAALNRIAEGHRSLASVKYLTKQVLSRAGWIGHGSGATHYRRNVDESVGYIEGVVADYLHHAGVGPSHLVGKHVLEIGPGDNLGVALTLLARGAASVTCVDRFSPMRDERRNLGIYRRLLERFTDEERARVRDEVSLEGESARFGGRIASTYGFPIEGAHEALGSGRFDVILSRAVLEHVADLPAAWDSMVRLLRPPGEMWHKVDFRNHGFFDRVHPLHFLTLGETSWRLLSSPDPTLNRERLPTYRRLAAETFSSNSYFVTHVLQGSDIVPHPRALTRGVDYGDAELAELARVRPRLDRRFRALDDHDLLASGIFLICRDLR